MLDLSADGTELLPLLSIFHGNNLKQRCSVETRASAYKGGKVIAIDMSTGRHRDMTVPANHKREVFSLIRTKDMRSAHCKSVWHVQHLRGKQQNDSTVLPALQPNLSPARQAQIILRTCSPTSRETIEMCIKNSISFTAEMPAFHGAAVSNLSVLSGKPRRIMQTCQLSRGPIRPRVSLCICMALMLSSVARRLAEGEELKLRRVQHYVLRPRRVRALRASASLGKRRRPEYCKRDDHGSVSCGLRRQPLVYARRSRLRTSSLGGSK